MSHSKIRLTVCFTLICWVAAAVPASAQHFALVGGLLSRVAAGRSEVWGLRFPGGLIYRFNPSINGFAPVAGSLSQIAVGGGSLLQPDQVWGVNGAGVFSFDLSTNAYTQHNPPGATTYFSQVAVGEGDLDRCHPYEVWGLAWSNSTWYGLPYRYNYCTGQFVQIPLPSGSTTPFSNIAVAARGSDVWALDTNAHIWHLTNTCICAASDWTQVFGGYDNDTLQQIAVGVNDVWGRDGNGSIYRFSSYPYGLFELVKPENNAGSAMQIAAGGDGVWAIEGGPDSYNGLRFCPMCGDYDGILGSGIFVPVGSFWTQVAVGSGAGVWVINSSNQVFTWVRP
ncbi:MAG: tectonin domain-containing protein [Candidatus Sulfotelmatobacter sp.]